MCKFHKDVARDIATNSHGFFNSGHYAVALVAMALFRVEQYMPAMHGCDGFNPSLMLTPQAKEAFEQSGLRRDQLDINAYRNEQIGFLRSAMALTAKSCDLSLSALNIQDDITEQGYQKNCCADPDPTQNGPFLDEAVVELFEGYDDTNKTWATRDLSLINEAHKPTFEPIRMAVEHFLSQDRIQGVLKKMFECSLASVFQNAQSVFDAGLGRDSEGCVMCGHGARALNPKVA